MEKSKVKSVIWKSVKYVCLFAAIFAVSYWYSLLVGVLVIVFFIWGYLMGWFNKANKVLEDAVLNVTKMFDKIEMPPTDVKRVIEFNITEDGKTEVTTTDTPVKKVNKKPKKKKNTEKVETSVEE